MGRYDAVGADEAAMEYLRCAKEEGFFKLEMDERIRFIPFGRLIRADLDADEVQTGT